MGVLTWIRYLMMFSATHSIRHSDRLARESKWAETQRSHGARAAFVWVNKSGREPKMTAVDPPGHSNQQELPRMQHRIHREVSFDGRPRFARYLQTPSRSILPIRPNSGRPRPRFSPGQCFQSKPRLAFQTQPSILTTRLAIGEFTTLAAQQRGKADSAIRLISRIRRRRLHAAQRR